MTWTIFSWRSSPKNMCSVRHSPMPSAPNSRALRASSGVSALVRTRRRAQLVGPPQDGVERLADLGLDERDVVGGDRAGRAVDGEPVAGVQRRRRRRAPRRPRGRSPGRWRRSPPGTPMPRATSAACEALPPSEVTIPLAAWKPATSSASVNGRARITSRPSAAAATASAAVKTISPDRRARRGGHAGGEHVVLGLRVEGRVQQRVERLGIDRRQRLRLVEQPLVHRVDREAHGGLRRALGVARLQHVQLALLDRELGVLHVAVVALELAQDLHELRRGRRA